MTRQILLMILLTMVSQTQAAAQTTQQEDAVGHFTYCPYVALFYSPYSASDESTGGHKIQAGFGFETEYRVNKAIGVSVGIELANFGVNSSSTLSDRYGPVHTFKSEYDMKTLNVPMMFNLHPLESNRLALRLGVQPGWILQSSSDRVSSGGMCFAVPLGLAVGLSDHIQIELRYHVGTTNFTEDERLAKTSQQTLALNLTYVIR